MLENIVNRVSDSLTDSMLKNMLTTDYKENVFDMVTTAQKITLPGALEACLRGINGEPIVRPLGSHNVQSPWNKLFLNPQQLFGLPTMDGTPINTEVVIGKNCKKPLKISMPVMLAAMSYGGSISLEAKTALAIAATSVGTATNTGESSVTDEERTAAKLLIGQYNRYKYLNTVDQLSKVDAIEVQLGQGAWGGAVPNRIKSCKIQEHLRNAWNLKEYQDGHRKARYESVNTPDDIVMLINKLKCEYDVPVGVKIAGSHYIEKELDVILQTNADFITIDGSEGGTAASMPTLQDNIGLPTLYVLARASKYLETKGVQDKYDLIITGGLKEPGDFLKSLALGAKAVYIGTIALIAMIQDQIIKAMPQYPSAQLVLYDGKLTDRLDVEKGSKSLENFLNSCNEEMKLALIALGKDSFTQLSRCDLVSVDKDLAQALNVSYAGDPCQ